MLLDDHAGPVVDTDREVLIAALQELLDAYEDTVMRRNGSGTRIAEASTRAQSVLKQVRR